METDLLGLKNGNRFITVTARGQPDKKVRVQGTIETPYFSISDLAKVLELDDSDLIENLRDDRKITLEKILQEKMRNSPSLGNDKATEENKNDEYTTESGFYSLVMNSESLYAKNLQKKILKILCRVQPLGSLFS